MKKTPGEQICIALLERPEQRCFDVVIERKAVTIGLTPGPMTEDNKPGIVPGVALPLRLRNLMAPGRTDGSSIIYLRETGYTPGTAVVAPGGLKPQTDLAYNNVLCPVTTIATFLKISKQAWEDFSLFESWIDSRLLYSLSVVEENQLLNGSGTAPNLQGVMGVAIATAAAGATLAGNVAAGIGALFGRGYVADGIVLNPADFGKALVAADAFQASYPWTLWGLPVVLSAAMASGSYLVGQFNPHAQIFDRESALVEVSDENQDDFVKDLLTVRAEERLALAIYQPNAFAKGTFTP